MGLLHGRGTVCLPLPPPIRSDRYCTPPYNLHGLMTSITLLRAADRSRRVHSLGHGSVHGYATPSAVPIHGRPRQTHVEISRPPPPPPDLTLRVAEFTRSAVAANGRGILSPSSGDSIRSRAFPIIARQRPLEIWHRRHLPDESIINFRYSLKRNSLDRSDRWLVARACFQLAFPRILPAETFFSLENFRCERATFAIKRTDHECDRVVAK